METENKQEHLESLLRQIPEIEPSSVILESVMGRIKPKKQKFWHQFFVFVQEQRYAFFKMSAMAASLCLAFWIGTKNQHSPVPQSVPLEIQQEKSTPIALGENPEANFLVGRGLLESGDNEKALAYLLKASELVPQNSDYAVWAGVGSAGVGNYLGERRQYERAISIEPKNLKANLYLGHNFADTGSFKEAIYYYDQVLEVDPTQPVALYNKALLLGSLGGEGTEVKTAWETYLDQYRSGKWAYQALEHLNSLGSFSYRAHQVGSRKVILRHDDLWRLNSQSDISEVRGLSEIVNIFSRQQAGFELHVIAYASGSPAMAKKKALRVREIIREALPSSRRGQIRASWFGVPEEMSFGTKKYSVDETVLLLGYPKKREEVAI